MPNLFAIAAPLALILPLFDQTEITWQVPVAYAARIGTGAECSKFPSDVDPDMPGRTSSPVAGMNDPVDSDPLGAFRAGQTAQQVRIERRVTIRISPRGQGSRSSLVTQLPRQAETRRFIEREMADCLQVSEISGVQTGSGNRLLLFLDDRRIVSLGLERSCRARDFYSGFYVERRDDGKLCVNRDRLHSRSGAKCEVERMRELVAADR